MFPLMLAVLKRIYIPLGIFCLYKTQEDIKHIFYEGSKESIGIITGVLQLILFRTVCIRGNIPKYGVLSLFKVWRGLFLRWV